MDLKKNVHPLDLAFRLAEDHGIVLLNGGGFEAPDWSVRVSFANLDDHVYDDIGAAVRAIARGYGRRTKRRERRPRKLRRQERKPRRASARRPARRPGLPGRGGNESTTAPV